jgi:hypothetical protein
MILTKGGELIEVYTDISGAVGWQDRRNVADKGRGAIPSTWDAQLKCWWVETKPIPMPNKVGINGNFYPIKPFTVQVDGVTRGDFGIHKDANVPGSAGRIVLPTDGDRWEKFERQMSKIAQEGVTRIPLQVVYS